MTLHKAIEAAREALTESIEWMGFRAESEERLEKCIDTIDLVKYTLSTLPAKPMSAVDIERIILSCIKSSNYSPSGTSVYIRQKLRDAGVLYCEEKE